MNTYILENNKIKVVFTDYAASVYQIYLKMNDELKPVLSTPKSLDTFIESTGSYGRTVGRTAGRLFKDEISSKYVDFKEESSLMHGGNQKFAAKVFYIESKTDTMINFSLKVNSFEDDYQGNLSVNVIYEIKDSSLIVKHIAKADNDSLLNMTFHPYFNLDQTNNLSTHTLKVNADYYLSQNEIGRFTKKEHVEGNHRDYRAEKQLIVTPETKLDGIYIINDDYACTLKVDGIQMNVYSNYDSLVVYTQNKLASHDLSNAVKDTMHAGIAIECQKPQSDLPLLKKDEVYDFYTKYEFVF